MVENYIMRLFQYFYFLKNVNIIDFFYLNYFCESVIRTDHYKLIPYKNSVIDISKNAKIYIRGGDIEIGCDLLKKSKAETRVRLRENAIWSSKNGCKISYGTTLEILDNAILNSGYFTVNCNSVIVVAKKMYLGQDVMIGRNAVLYDSDFHQMLDKKGKTLNPASQVKVGSHVWIGANSTILKGTMIGQNSVIGANAVVNGEVPEKVIFNIKREKFVRNEFEKWDRKSPN